MSGDEIKTYDLEYVFEAMIVATACQVPTFWGRIAHVVEIEAFPSQASRDALAAVRDIAKERGTGPDSAALVLQRLRAWNREGKLDRVRLLAVFELIDDADDNGFNPASYEAYLGEFVPQLKDREIQGATIDLIEESTKPPTQANITRVLNRIKGAERLGERDLTTGFRLGVPSLERIKSLSMINRLPTGVDDLDFELAGGMGCGLGVFVAGTGVGKCHAAGTRVVKYDGSLIAVEDVRVGDLLMGPDSKPRSVLTTVSGEDHLYEIIPARGGEPWRVNVDHVLTLSGENQQLIDVPVRVFLSWPEKKKRQFSLVHAGPIDFPKTESAPKDPYEVGISLCTEEDEAPENLTKDQPFRIPAAYKTSSKFFRKRLLSGLINTYGIVTKKGLEYIALSKEFANDVCFVARSLGLYSYIKNVSRGYWLVSMQGSGCWSLPRLKIPENVRIDLSADSKCTQVTSKFSIRKIDRTEKYFGFSLDGDHRYLLDDFTITHNSMFLSHLATNSLLQGLHVAYATLELGTEEIEARVVANLVGLPINDLMAGQDQELATERLEAMEQHFGSLQTRYFTPRATTVTDIIQWCGECESESGAPVNLVIIDMASRLKGYKEASKQQASTYKEQGDIFTDFRNWLKATHKWGWTGDQPQRGAKDKKKIDTDDVSDSIDKSRECDLMVTAVLSQDEAMIEYFVAKNRHAAGRKSVGPLPHEFAMGRMVPLQRKIAGKVW